MTRIVIFRHYADYHRPRIYRYRVAEQAAGFRLVRNIYGTGTGNVVTRGSDYEVSEGTAWIGLALVAGRYAYCVKWAHARLDRIGGAR